MPKDDYFDFCDRARAAIARREYVAGRDFFEKALELKADSFDARYGLANAQMLLKEYTKAIDAYQKALELSPRHAGATINLGAIYSLLKDFDSAVTHLQRAIQIDSSNSDAFYNLGIAYKNLGKLDLAADAYSQAHRLNPKLIDPLFNLANLNLELERFDRAEDYYRKVLEIDPQLKKATDGLRTVERRKAQKEEGTTAGDVDAEEEVAITSEIENDPRFDRVFDPQRDRAILEKFNTNARQARDDSVDWLDRNRRLDESIRVVIGQLAADPTSEGFRKSITGLRTSLGDFQKSEKKFGERLTVIDKTRDRMVDGSTNEARILQLEKEVKELREFVESLELRLNELADVPM